MRNRSAPCFAKNVVDFSLGKRQAISPSTQPTAKPLLLRCTQLSRCPKPQAQLPQTSRHLQMQKKTLTYAEKTRGENTQKGLLDCHNKSLIKMEVMEASTVSPHVLILGNFNAHY